MPEQPFEEKDVLLRCRDAKWSHDPNVYIYIKDDLVNTGISVFSLDEWGHYQWQDCDGFLVRLVLDQLRESQEREKKYKIAIECILGHCAERGVVKDDHLWKCIESDGNAALAPQKGDGQ